VGKCSVDEGHGAEEVGLVRGLPGRWVIGCGDGGDIGDDDVDVLLDRDVVHPLFELGRYRNISCGAHAYAPWKTREAVSGGCKGFL